MRSPGLSWERPGSGVGSVASPEAAGAPIGLEAEERRGEGLSGGRLGALHDGEPRQQEPARAIVDHEGRSLVVDPERELVRGVLAREEDGRVAGAVRPEDRHDLLAGLARDRVAHACRVGADEPERERATARVDHERLQVAVVPDLKGEGVGVRRVLGRCPAGAAEEEEGGAEDEQEEGTMTHDLVRFALEEVHRVGFQRVGHYRRSAGVCQGRQ